MGTVIASIWTSVRILLLFVLLAQDANELAFLTEHPLANGFPLSAGQVTVKMPTNVPPRDDYIVVREFSSSPLRTYEHVLTPPFLVFGDSVS